VHQIDRQPGPAVAHRIHDGREDVFLFAQAGLRQQFFFRLFADEVHHLVHGQPPDQFVVVVDHRRRHQVVALEGLGRRFGAVRRTQHQRMLVHHARHLHIHVVDQQRVERQRTAHASFAVDHENLVGVVGQFVEQAQIAQHDLERHVFAHRHHVEVHQRADRIVGVGHGGAQLFALFHVERAEHVLHDLDRQVGREVGQFVGIELFDCGDQLLRLHGVDQRLADRIRHLEQDFAVALGAHQIPHQQAVVRRQRFEDVGDVGRVHRVELFRQLAVVLLRHQRFHQLVARHFLAVPSHTVRWADGVGPVTQQQGGSGPVARPWRSAGGYRSGPAGWAR
jgi:hypothetical protein